MKNIPFDEIGVTALEQDACSLDGADTIWNGKADATGRSWIKR